MKSLGEPLRPNLRRLRASQLSAMVIQVVAKHADPDALNAIHVELYQMFHDHGAELISDFDRQQHGMSPRGPDGWTAEEMLLLERFRVLALQNSMKPIMVTPGDILDEPK